jgi:hypothetical protein
MLKSAQYAEEDIQKIILKLNIIYNTSLHLSLYMRANLVIMQSIYQDTGQDI